MKLHLLKSKIHQAVITRTELGYEGSLTIDQDLMDSVGLLPNERILVVNATNGQRLETYAIVGERGTGVICLNGAAARRGEGGDQITIMNFGIYDEAEAAGHKPAIIILDKQNRIVQRK